MTNSVMPVYTVVTADGKPSVLLNIYRQPASNTVDVANAVHTEMRLWNGTCRAGVEIRPFYDQSGSGHRVHQKRARCHPSRAHSGAFIMVLFLRDWGTSLVAGLVIPATIGVTFIALRALDRAST